MTTCIRSPFVKSAGKLLTLALYLIRIEPGLGIALSHPVGPGRRFAAGTFDKRELWLESMAAKYGRIPLTTIQMAENFFLKSKILAEGASDMNGWPRRF